MEHALLQACLVSGGPVPPPYFLEQRSCSSRSTWHPLFFPTWSNFSIPHRNNRIRQTRYGDTHTEDTKETVPMDFGWPNLELRATRPRGLRYESAYKRRPPPRFPRRACARGDQRSRL